MKRALLIALIWGWTASVVGQTTPTILSGFADGEYVLTIAGGVARVTPAILLRPVDPVDPVDPRPAPVARTREIQAAAAGATADPQRAATATALAAAMTDIRAEIDAGRLMTYQEIATAALRMIDSATSSHRAAWAPTKDIVARHLAELAQEGAKPDAYSVYFGEAADGFTASVPKRENIEEGEAGWTGQG